MVLLLALAFLHQADAAEVSRLLVELGGAEESSRLDAFDHLREIRDPQVAERLKKALDALSEESSRKALGERTRVLKDLVAIQKKALSAKTHGAQQKEVFRLLQVGDTGPMGPVVREMWENFYVNPFKAEEDDKVVLAKNRALQFAHFIDSLGGSERTPAEDQFRLLVRAVDEEYLCQSMPEKDQKVMKENRALRAPLGEEEYLCMLLTNQYRVLLGKNALRVNLKLVAAARDHSKDMNEMDFFAHESPVPGKKTPSDRAARQGAKANAENIAKGFGSGESVFWGWFTSIGHSRNMVGDFAEIGVGQTATAWTEMFGSP